MFKKLAKQLKSNYMEKDCFPMTSPMKDNSKYAFLKTMSKQALDLYERQTDINNFTKLALSDPENQSHNEIMAELFNEKGVKDLCDEHLLFELSENTRFLEDLGIDTTR